MVRELMKDTVFLAQKALPAAAEDIPTADDLLDTLRAHADGCVGMAANMIGVNKAIIVFDDEGTLREMFNPEIVYHKGLYLAEEGCLSLQGQRKAKRHKTIKVPAGRLSLCAVLIVVHTLHTGKYQTFHEL